MDALAAVIRRVVADVASERQLTVEPQTSQEFRQSYQTARMIEVYERVLARPRA